MSDLVRGGAGGPPPATPPSPPAAPPSGPEAPRPAAAGPPPPPDSRPAARTPAPPTDAAAGPGRTGQEQAAPPPDGKDPGPPALEPRSLLGALVRALEATRDRVEAADAFSWGSLSVLVERMINALEGSDDLFWLAQSPEGAIGRDWIALHQTRVCALALRLGLAVGWERRRLVEVGLAACVFDVGLWRLSPESLQRLEALDAEEQARYRAHPRTGADIVRRWQPPFEGLVDAVLQHHERERGQGFPQALAGADIHPYAKVLGLADTYAWLTLPPGPRPGLRPHDAVREILRVKNELFAGPLVKALLSEITVFPPGTLVRLNTGEAARVVAVNRQHPLRPRIEVVEDRNRRPAEPRVLDLSEAPFLYITGSVAEERVGR